MTFLFSVIIGKCSLEREHKFLTKVVSIMNSCFIKYNVPFVKNVKVAQLINLFCQEWLVFCQLQINLNFLEIKSVSVTVHDKFQLVCVSLEVYTYFSGTIISYPY